MIRIAVASGKGGTGKTTVATSLALHMARERAVHLLDCDVEAPNSALFLHPAFDAVEDVPVPVPRIDESVCTHCGECSGVCAFHALATTPNRVLVFPELCRGCGGCARVCPAGAITEVSRPVGTISQGTAGNIRITQGTLNAGEIATVRLVRAVRATEVAAEVVIVDCPPGTNCPVVTAVDGAHFVVLVTEPTPFGLNDLRLAAEMVANLGLRTGVVINRDEPGDDRIDRFCKSSGLPIIGRIKDDRRVAEVYSRGDLPFSALGSFRTEIEALALRLKSEVGA
jgi:MinD superfamily P-loop ATPase